MFLNYRDASRQDNKDSMQFFVRTYANGKKDWSPKFLGMNGDARTIAKTLDLLEKKEASVDYAFEVFDIPVNDCQLKQAVPCRNFYGLKRNIYLGGCRNLRPVGGSA
jgi:hypothetical protein